MNTNDRKNYDPDPMSHEQATKNHVAERFALGELSHEDRERFEDHFFDCDQCFGDVQLASEFLHGAYNALSRKREIRPALKFLTEFWRPAPAILAVLFLCATGTGLYQESKIRELKGPKQASRFYLKEQTRSAGSEQQITVPRGVRLALEAELTPQPEFKSYRARIVSEPDKRVRYTVPLQVSEDELVTIVMPSEILEEGNYSLIFEGKRNDDSWIVLKEHNQPAGGVFHLRVVS
jgi:hypothetical protein